MFRPLRPCPSPTALLSRRRPQPNLHRPLHLRPSPRRPSPVPSPPHPIRQRQRHLSTPPAPPVHATLIDREALFVSWSPSSSPTSSAGSQPNITPYRWSWLLDSCPCPRCIDPSTTQKLHKSSSIPSLLRPPPGAEEGTDALSVAAGEGPVRWVDTADALSVTWSPEHTSTYPRAWLWQHSSPEVLALARHSPPARTPWTAATLRAPSSPLPWPLSAHDRGLALHRLLKYGLVFLSGVPRDAAGAAGREGILDVVDAFGTLHETFYGRTWDVRSVVGSANVAYTDRELGFHQDLLYMRSPPAYQILHMLTNRVTGGSSSFTDGLSAGLTFKRASRPLFGLLARYPVPFHYVNGAHAHHCSHTTLAVSSKHNGVDPWGPPAPPPLLPPGAFDGAPGEPGGYALGYGTGTGKLPARRPNRGKGMRGALKHELGLDITGVHYSPPFQAPLPVGSPPELVDALRMFDAALHREGAVVQYRMEDGDCVVFDNRRVLHAREAFDSAEGERWLKGCYLEEEGVVTNWRRAGVYEEAAGAVDEEEDEDEEE